jgi:exoribonuclease-2
MGTKALPHAGIGVPAYAWSTSPLRRYTYLVNQWQIIAAVQHGATAALVAPFKPKSAELFSIISAFEAAYSAYNGYQAGMERFWTLQYLQQNGLSELVVTVFKDGTHGGTHGVTNSGGNGGVLARADHLPLVLPVFGQGNGQAPLTRGDKVRVKLSAIDLIGLEVSGQVIERLDDLNSKLAAETAEGFEFELEDDEAAAGPIAIAVDVTEVSAEAPLETPIA